MTRLARNPSDEDLKAWHSDTAMPRWQIEARAAMRYRASVAQLIPMVALVVGIGIGGAAALLHWWIPVALVAVGAIACLGENALLKHRREKALALDRETNDTIRQIEPPAEETS